MLKVCSGGGAEQSQNAQFSISALPPQGAFRMLRGPRRVKIVTHVNGGNQ